jgi:hypothetical protein
VGEITLEGEREIGANANVNLGNFYANPARSSEFGVTVEDATFEYSLKSGAILTGLVEYTGAHNSLVLVVDPETGDTWIQNQSAFDLNVDGYEIESASGALEPEQWESFASTDSDWTEANPIDVHIGELNLTGSRDFAGESAAVSLGNIFTPGAERDLVFRFNLAASDGNEAMTLLGIIEYEEGPIDFGPGGGLPGDYNGNGTVEQADLDLVLLNWGQPGVPGGWINDLPEGNIDQAELDGVLLNWGNTGALGSAAAVPEPATSVLALLGVSLVVAIRCRAKLG